MFNNKYVISKGLAFAEDEEMEMLSSYAKKGWILYKLEFWGYKLKKVRPQELQYSLDYRSNADDEYFSYFKESGWNHVCSAGSFHVFSSQKGTKPIYTDSDTKLEKYISQYNLTKRISIPAFLCSILSIILILLARNNYIPDIFIKTFGIVLIPVLVIAIYSGLPCISYYSTINKIKNDSPACKKHKVIKKIINKSITPIFILFTSFFLLSIFKIIIISKAVFFSICLAVIIFCFLSASIK